MLNYFALSLLIFVALVLFYGIIAIHDIPYEIAKKREHPQQDAIHVAGWISLLTLHVMWPFLWVWATLYRPDRGWGFIKETQEKADILRLQNLILDMQPKLSAAEIENKDNHAKLAAFKSETSEYRAQLASLTEHIQELQVRIEAIELRENKENP